MFEAYSVGVRISLINGVSSGLMAMSRQFAKAQGDVDGLQRRLDRIKRTMLVGAGLTAGGVGIFGLIGKTLPAASEYNHQLAQMNVAGMKHAEIARSITAAWNASRELPTSKVSENLAMIRELRTVFGTSEEAINALPGMIRLQAVLSNVKGVKDAKGTAYTVAKLLDIRGASMDPKRFQLESDMMLKAIVGSGGTLDPTDFFGTGKYGRLATQGWSAEFMYQILPTLMQEMKSGGGGGMGGPGNALMSAYAAVVSGQMTQKSLELWNKLGLLDPSKVVWSKDRAHTKGVLPGGIRGTEVFQANPFEWTQRYLVPALRQAGITDPQKQQQYIGQLFATRTAGFVMAQMALQPNKFLRDQRLLRGAEGMKAYDTLMKTDPIMAQQAMAAQWNNLLTTFGIAILPDLIALMQQLVPLMASFTRWLREHPKGLQTFMRGLASLGGLLMAIGGILLTGGTISAFGVLFRTLGAGAKIFAVGGPLIVRGLSLAGTAIAGLVTAVGWPVVLITAGVAAIGVAIWQIWKHWDKTKGFFDNMKDILGGFFTWVINKARALAGLPALQADGVAPTVKAPSVKAPAVPKSGYNPFDPWGTVEAYKNSQGGSRHVPAVKPSKMSSVGDVHIDGEKVGKVVWRRQADELDRATRGSSGFFDPGMSLSPVGLGYA